MLIVANSIFDYIQCNVSVKILKMSPNHIFLTVSKIWVSFQQTSVAHSISNITGKRKALGYVRNPGSQSSMSEIETNAMNEN